MNELSYIDENGNTVFTSYYYRQRKSCCKTNCLHCPYGYTLKNSGVLVEPITKKTESLAKEFFNNEIQNNALSSSLLKGAFKSHPKSWKKENYAALYLKGFFVGLAEFQNEKFVKHYLKEKFNDQGITDTYIRSILPDDLC